MIECIYLNTIINVSGFIRCKLLHSALYQVFLSVHCNKNQLMSFILLLNSEGG